MRMITIETLEDLARGSAVLASGGGGDPYRGQLAATAALQAYGPVTLVRLDELPDDAILSSPFIIGAPLAMLEKFPYGVELERAFTMMEERAGRRIDALFAGEIGGINSMLPFALAAKKGIPVVDADTMGRAYPELDMNLTTLSDLSLGPIMMTDDDANEVTISSPHSRVLERIGRQVALQAGAAVGVMGVCRPVAEMRDALVSGTITLAQAVGQVLRDADRDPEGACRRVMELTGGAVIFEGRITGLRQDIDGAFGKGEVTISGTAHYEGRALEITVINENLSAISDGQVLASCPDIITIFDAQSGQALTTENVRYGYRVRVAGLPCDARWLTPQGLALGGPDRFAFKHDYVPFAGRSSDQRAVDTTLLPCANSVEGTVP